ncbi:MAG: retroviral-like aspartic protease family protein, partial [Proteobacteria bacterium]|nr:retroviral-like aspartic protease family protein [Pseudomonadota bacterium]
MQDGNRIPNGEPSNLDSPDGIETVRGNLLLNDEEWYQELRQRHRAILGMKAQWERNYEEREQYASPESKFYNPDAWSRLIGQSNVVPTYINGEAVQTLLDTGAQISFISERYARRRGFKIHPIEKLV